MSSDNMAGASKPGSLRERLGKVSKYVLDDSMLPGTDDDAVKAADADAEQAPSYPSTAHQKSKDAALHGTDIALQAKLPDDTVKQPSQPVQQMYESEPGKHTVRCMNAQLVHQCI